MPFYDRLLACSLGALLLIAACGQVRTVPADFNPNAYTPVDFAQLLEPGKSRLSAGQLICCQALFWEFLTYDPAPVYYYLNQLRYPFSWGALEWFSLYQSSDLQGYFPRAAMTYAQRLDYAPKRFDPIIIYGELVPLGGRQLYPQVHHLKTDRLD
ncbi:hypothetical protein [Desulfobacca acetoxidans]|uniref:Lipoprotein n=1 Tax=Desulfobacca acetoxidans (strain ATCC 700848 / DSM 11109 / ASRB2) TaxID=880072 RepID=F2NHW5_DESAR|nr:hypothetical protein [Desulfobacca acetoxidans]AEB09450.1 hypothetical protein Desac_1598 [Desulfobacca acetoxidans DSM 11109]